VSAWVEPVTGAPVRFRSRGAGREPDAEGRARDVELVPFYRMHRRTYATYWDVFRPDEWKAQKEAYAAEAERLRRLEAATVAYLESGETVCEREFHYRAGDGVVPHRMLGRAGRRGRTWFSFEVPVEPDRPMTLIATYYAGDRRGTPAEFQVLIDGQPVAREERRLTDPHRFVDAEYPLPAGLVASKERVTVRFQAAEYSQIATVFGLRMIRGDARR